MTGDIFWRMPNDTSLVKIAIVDKYFSAWSNVMLSRTTEDICYADLYAGRGEYVDGTLTNRVDRLHVEPGDGVHEDQSGLR